MDLFRPFLQETAVNIKNISRTACAALCLCASSTFAAESLCTPGGYAVGFFNGVFNTNVQATDALQAIKRLDVSQNTHNEIVKYEVYYNQTGLDRPNVTRFEDVIEVFRQRAAEQDGVLDSRWELFWEALSGNTGDGSISGTIFDASVSLSNIISATRTDILANTVSALSGFLSNPPTQIDYAEQQTLIDAHIVQKEKIILIAHSQGNLFMNAAYNYAVAKAAAGSVKAVHIAPASPTLNGPYTLANLDVVINALRITGTVPDINVYIPGLLLRPPPSDPSGHELVATYLNSGLLQPRPQIQSHLQQAFATAVTPPATGTDANGFFTVTLTWNGPGDIDLLTSEPAGTFVFYGARLGLAGELDRDNTVANGPEHYYASCDPAKLQLGTYLVGINNYARGDGRTATVQVSTNKEGVLATKTLGVGVARASAGNKSPIPAVSVNVSKNEKDQYVVTAQ
jgi:hypothetical protein